MQLPFIYIIIGLILVVAEVLVPGFVLLPLGLAAMGTGVVAAFLASPIAHVVTFCALGLGLFYAMAKWRHLTIAAPREPIALGPVGQIGTLVERCESPQRPGKVQVFSDTWELFWDDSDPFWLEELRGLEAGKRLRITGVVGNKVHVQRAD